MGTDSPPKDDLVVRTSDGGRRHLISVSGEVDYANAPRLRDALAGAQQHPRVLLDLRGVTFIDSSGALLVDAAVRAPGRDVDVIASRPVRRLLDLLGSFRAAG